MDLREVTEFFRDFLGYIITIGIILFIFIFVVAIQPVAGNSMSPTLTDGDLTLVSKFAYKFSTIKRNQIVVLRKNNKLYVKRVVGLPGEEIHYLKGILYVDGKPYKETFLEDGIETNSFMFEDVCSKKDCPDGVIPKNMYLVLGDNRPESKDSRDNEIGLIKKDEIKGRVFFRVFPFSGFGKVN